MRRKILKSCMWQRIDFSTNSTETTGHTHTGKKNKLETTSYDIKINSKWMINLNVKSKNCKTSRKRHKIKSLRPRVWQIFLRYNTTTIIHKKGIN